MSEEMKRGMMPPVGFWSDAPKDGLMISGDAAVGRAYDPNLLKSSAMANKAEPITLLQELKNRRHKLQLRSDGIYSEGQRIGEEINDLDKAIEALTPNAADLDTAISALSVDGNGPVGEGGREAEIKAEERVELWMLHELSSDELCAVPSKELGLAVAAWGNEKFKAKNEFDPIMNFVVEPWAGDAESHAIDIEASWKTHYAINGRGEEIDWLNNPPPIAYPPLPRFETQDNPSEIDKLAVDILNARDADQLPTPDASSEGDDSGTGEDEAEPAEFISDLTGDPAVEPESGLHGETSETVSEEPASSKLVASLDRAIDLARDLARAVGADVVHASDCAVHNEPAFPNGPCDCGAQPPTDVARTGSDSLPAEADRADQQTPQEDTFSLGKVLAHGTLNEIDAKDKPSFMEGIAQRLGLVREDA